MLSETARFGLGTTAVTNVLAERRGRRVGLITTKGFEDEVPLNKGRHINVDGWLRYPPQLVARRCIIGVSERVDREGRVLEPLDIDEVAAAARRLVEREDVEALAVSFLWSFKHPAHEEAAVAEIREQYPALPVISAVALSPSIREFERTTFALFNAYVGDACRGVESLAEDLVKQGLRVPLLLVHSAGGAITVPEARRVPIGLAFSGPAAGVAAAVVVGEATSAPDVITCDMGGTSTDISVIRRGQATRRTRGELFGTWTALPFVDIQSIGAGGGSIGWVDARGMLRVGPHSAGSRPGPASYGQGGTEPTVTDALTVLGYIDPAYFLGGAMTLDLDAAWASCAAVGERLGLGARDVAWGIRELALEGMVRAVRSFLNARGLDSSSLPILSYGGCGSLFAADLARAVGSGQVIVPRLASVLSAFGAATTDIRRARVQSVMASLPVEAATVQALADKLAAEVLDDLVSEGARTDAVAVHFEVDLRFKRQIGELTIPLPVPISEAGMEGLIAEFQEDYVRRYGRGSILLGVPIEMVTVRAVGTAQTPRAVLVGEPGTPRAGTPTARLEARPVALERDPAPSRRRHYLLRNRPPHGRRDGRPRHRGRTGYDDLGPRGRPGQSRSRRHLPDGPGLVNRLDPIRLEVFRSRLAAIAEEAGDSIERTAISPIVTESKDYSATILDAAGNLIVGGGAITFHWVAATRSVRATLERYAHTIVAGDVFLTNDPYNGGGLHANDVFVLRPVFWSEKLVAWVATSSHLMDVGGMVMGSFAPAATDCYQEGLRIPPAHLLHAGEEVREIWDIFRTNIRLAELNEMDLRALIAGSYVAEQKLIELIDSIEYDFYDAAITAIRDLSETQMRARIAEIGDGVYRVVNWTEWNDELYRVPCTLTISGDSLVFDFEGASPQAPHYFNSQPYIIKSSAMSQLAPLLVPDLPYSEGLLAPIEVRCPEGTIVHATPPAPINAGHYQVSITATEAMLHCLKLALWASSPAPDAAKYVMAREAFVAAAMNGWSGIGLNGRPDTWIFLDCILGGASGSNFGDGQDVTNANVGPPGIEIAEVEILESSYPILIRERGVNRGVNGAGRHRSGGGRVLRFEPYGTDHLDGQLMGTRRYFVCEGVAGGAAGSPAGFFVRHEDGSVEPVPMVLGGLELRAGEQFEVRCASGGGFGDPLDRDPHAVATDVAEAAISVSDAAEVYGVVLIDGRPDLRKTDQRRAKCRQDRLEHAQAPRRVPRPPRSKERGGNGPVPDGSDEAPMHPGIIRRGRFAMAEESGAVLAESPDHWTDGCPTLEVRRPGPAGTDLLVRSYIDPISAAILYTEVCPDNEPRTFEISPGHWVNAS